MLTNAIHNFVSIYHIKVFLTQDIRVNKFIHSFIKAFRTLSFPAMICSLVFRSCHIIRTSCSFKLEAENEKSRRFGLGPSAESRSPIVFFYSAKCYLLIELELELETLFFIVIR